MLVVPKKGNQVAKFKITGTYEYEGVVEAKTEDEAFSVFYKNLNNFYQMPVDEEVTILCDDCEEEYGICNCEEEE